MYVRCQILILLASSHIILLLPSNYYCFNSPFYIHAVSSVGCSSLVKWLLCWWFGSAALENSIKVKGSLTSHVLIAERKSVAKFIELR